MISYFVFGMKTRKFPVFQSVCKINGLQDHNGPLQHINVDPEYVTIATVQCQEIGVWVVVLITIIHYRVEANALNCVLLYLTPARRRF